MKKVLALLMTIALMTSVFLMGTFLVKASAENTLVNIYDTQTLEAGLTTADADIVLWNDITYSGSVKVLCHSIDLNGYKLVYDSKMTLDSGNTEFVILDSLFEKGEENTGKLEIKQGVYGLTSNIRIESGTVFIYNSSGKNGEKGITGSNGEPLYQIGRGRDGGNGYGGGDGGDGGDGLVVNSLCIQGGKITITGGTGGNGGNGGDGGRGGFSNATGGDGGDGGTGGNGGDGGNGIVANIVEISGGVIEVNGGTGGSGSCGGNGGRGGGTGGPYYQGGNGGNGGAGGNGGNGSNGITATVVKISGGVITASAGNGGSSGTGGAGGAGGDGNYTGGSCGSDGGDGYIGNGGIGGCGIASDDVIIGGGQLLSSGGVGTEKNNLPYGGGSGICGNLTVNDGSVYAYGKYDGAGIGGAGNVAQKQGSNVKITGGYVFAQGAGNAFDIGGGYCNGSVGLPGTLEVTGGTLELATYGRATNVSSPVFKNCIVTGEGAYQHEGTYNADGKFTVTVEDIRIDPSKCIGYDTVIVTADVHISRASNITTPKLKGYIFFKLDGREFATAPITDAIAADGLITATASADWVAVEGEHRLSAEYVAGANDMYTFGETYAESIDIPLHAHQWNSEYTVDVQPSCTTPGSKSIHCTLCDVQKEFAVVDAIGHDYVDNLCKNCQEFLPLIIFKDYNGTILSSEYYYLGDLVTEPEAPFREKDNIYTYAFIGWDKEVTVCEGDMVYTAVYESTFREYTVIFKNYDGSELLCDTYHYGDLVATPSKIPQKVADQQYTYTFAGWDKIVVNCEGNATYTATYTSTYIDYTVVFKNWNGDIISTQTCHWGDGVTPPANPLKASDNTYTYKFAGWNKDVVNCAGDTTYTATYTPTYIDYTIVFKNWDGSVISTKTYHYGDKVTAPSNPNKASDNTYTYKFAGWNKDVVNCAGDTIYTATYTSTYIDYTVIFKNEDGTVLFIKIYHWGDKVTTPAEPTKVPDNIYTYAFAGWDKPVVNCAGSTTYTATYTSIYIDYAVVFKDWNGTVISTKTYHWGDTVIAPANPIRPYDKDFIYTFADWDKEITPCDGNVVYTATYNKTAIVVTSIEVTTKPNKLTYLEGDAFDKTGMVVTAYYNNNTSKTVTDYNISGYTSTVGAKTITITYEGKTATFTITVNSRIPSSATSSKYTIVGGNISKISVGTTAKSLLSGLNEGSYCKVYNGKTEVTGNATIGTGMVVKIMDGNTVKASYTVVVTGDTNGDGKISVTDMLAVKAHVLKKSTLSGAAAQAADTSGDNAISITDFIQLKAQILGKSNVEPRTVTKTQTTQDTNNVAIVTADYTATNTVVPKSQPMNVLNNTPVVAIIPNKKSLVTMYYKEERGQI